MQEETDDGTPPGKTTAYTLTLMKKLSQSTKSSKVKERAVDWDLIRELYRPIEPVLRVSTLTQEAILYFAHSVIKSEIFQLTRRDATW
jgi:hypothetical protein